VALPVAVAAVLVSLAIINIAMVKTWRGGLSAAAPSGLYYSLALVGVLAIVVGASVRLRRPNDPATLHFFWLTVAFFGVLAFTPPGRGERWDGFFDWATAIARLALPPLFFHFGFVFPERPNPWVRSRVGRVVLWLIYVPAFALGLARAQVLLASLHGPAPVLRLHQLHVLSDAYLAVCLPGALILMMRALTRLRSVTAMRQLRWIVWGSSVGALPFVLLYVVPVLLGDIPPFAEYTAV
jgi:hypothetical protein